MSSPSDAADPTKAAKAPKRKSSYHHGNLREALTEIAVTLLEEHGAANLSLRMLARELGVSQTAPYHHFEDKNALLAAIAAEGFRKAAQVLRTVSINHHSLERRVRGLCAGYVRFAREKPEMWRLMYGTAVQHKETYPELVEASNEAFEALAARVEEMMIEFGIDHIGPKQAAMYLLGLNHGLATMIVDPRSSSIAESIIGDERQVVAEAAKLFVAGFRPCSIK
ncbi:TetR/AcrR family transcriptional regulator [Pseudomonas putida]